MMALQEINAASVDTLDVYVVYAADAIDAAWVMTEQLRDRGVSAAIHGLVDGAAASFKSQMKKADGSGARFAIIMGSDEVAQSKLSVKDLRGGDIHGAVRSDAGGDTHGGAQQLMTIDEAAALILSARRIR